jgi:peptidyl-tRNA hydrolase, PTH1 family
MKLVIGLGNPGPEYERTRHNIGFRVVDKLAAQEGWKWNERRSRAVLASGNLGLEKVTLVKPITYMNLSGEAVGELARWFKVRPEDMLVIYDELDLPVGKVRLRPNGSAAGHNGMKSIIHNLHTDAIPRLRVGVDHPTNTHIQGKDHVLGVPTIDESILIERAEDRAVEAIRLVITQGIATTMNMVNADPEEAKRKAEEQERRRQERAERQRLKREREAAAKALTAEGDLSTSENTGISPASDQEAGNEGNTKLNME